MMFAAAAIALLVTLALAVARAVLGPTVFDRVQAANTVGTVAMLLLAVFGFLTGRPEFLDLAITYGLLNIIGTVAVLKYFRHGNLGDPGLNDAGTEAAIETENDAVKVPEPTGPNPARLVP